MAIATTTGARFNYFECLVRQNYRMGRMPWRVRPQRVRH